MQDEKAKSREDDSPVLPDVPTNSTQKNLDEIPPSPLKLARQISMFKPEPQGEQRTSNEATRLREFEDLKGIKGERIINYGNDQFIGFKTNVFEINSIDNEMIYHNVSHFNSNNQGISNMLNTNILEL